MTLRRLEDYCLFNGDIQLWKVQAALHERCHDWQARIGSGSPYTGNPPKMAKSIGVSAPITH